MLKSRDFTPLKPKPEISSPSFSKESEPLGRRPESEQVKMPEMAPEKPESKTENKEAEDARGIEIVPEEPEVDEDLAEQGVEAVSHTSVFVRNKKVELPLSLDKIEAGLHEPPTSGMRWVAELTKYILSKFHLVIKKVGKTFKLVES